MAFPPKSITLPAVRKNYSSMPPFMTITITSATSGSYLMEEIEQDASFATTSSIASLAQKQTKQN